MFCRICGARLEDAYNFCDRCGAPVLGNISTHYNDDDELPEDSILIPSSVLKDIKIAYLMNYFNGKVKNNYIPGYISYRAGNNWHALLNDAFSIGLIAWLPPYKSLPFLTTPELKQLLREHDLKLSGKKQDLIDRIIENIGENSLEDKTPLVYNLTSKVEEFVEKYKVYIISMEPSSFTLGQIYEMENIFKSKKIAITPYAIFIALYSQDIENHINKKEWGSLANTYRSCALRFKDENPINALSLLFKAFYIDLSGLKGDDFLIGYERVFSNTKYYTKDIDALLFKLSLSQETIKKIYLESTEPLESMLPFCYFSPQISFALLTDLVNNSFVDSEKYRRYSRTPPAHYHVY